MIKLRNSISTAASSRTPGPLVNKGYRFDSQTKGKQKIFVRCSLLLSLTEAERERAPRLERDCDFIITSLGKLTWNKCKTRPQAERKDGKEHKEPLGACDEQN